MFPLIEASNYDQQVLSSKGVVLINFWANWCDECQQMSLLMEEISHFLHKGDTILQVDWDKEKQLAQKAEVIGVPTLLFYFKGNEISRYFGIISKDELLNQINKLR